MCRAMLDVSICKYRKQERWPDEYTEPLPDWPRRGDPGWPLTLAPASLASHVMGLEEAGA